MILDREVYFSYPPLFRVLRFFKKFFYILFRFLGRPNWGRMKAGEKLALEKQDLVLIVNKDGTLRCTSCQECVKVCPTSCLQVSSLENGTSSQPALFHFEPLKCMNCNWCEEVCPEDALSFIPTGKSYGHCEDDWAKDLHYLAFREELNDGKGLTLEELQDIRESANIIK
jgi:formate hydrogenlyase subunit 6/NADH:ubiquinone oxidoreductase subunit I